MSDGTLQPEVASVSSATFNIEMTTNIRTGSYKASTKLSDFPRIATLRSLFACVELVHAEVEVRQVTIVGTNGGELDLNGSVYVGLVPTSKDSDSATGGSAAIVNNVVNKQAFPLSTVQQANMVFQLNLKGYELDLAQDPRRGCGPVAWLGNSGIRVVTDDSHKEAAIICSATWRLGVRCAGETALWI